MVRYSFLVRLSHPLLPCRFIPALSLITQFARATSVKLPSRRRSVSCSEFPALEIVPRDGRKLAGANHHPVSPRWPAEVRGLMQFMIRG